MSEWESWPAVDGVRNRPNRPARASVTAIALSVAMVMAGCSADPEGFSEAEVASLLASKTTRSVSTSMSFGACLAMVGRIGNAGSTPPTNIVETGVLRMVRFGMAEGGSLLVTCSAEDRKAVLTRSFE